jgi:hypothetical protein
MKSYRRPPDRGNKLATDKGLGPQSSGAAGPMTRIDPATVQIDAPPKVNPKYLAYLRWCRMHSISPKPIEQWRLRR